MSGKWLIPALFALTAVVPLHAEVFDLWPWKSNGDAPAGASRIGELPGTATQLHTEEMQVNGETLEMKVSSLDIDFATLAAILAKRFPAGSIRAGDDAIRIAYLLREGTVERWLLVDGGIGKPVTLFVIVAPEKLPPPPAWPVELPPLPSGAQANQIVRFPARQAVYGSFREAGDKPEELAQDLTGSLRTAGWRALGEEAGHSGDGNGGIFLHDRPRRILWASFGANGNGVFYSRPY